MRISSERLKKVEVAKNADLINFLLANNIKFKNQNGYYRHMTHESLIVYPIKKDYRYKNSVCFTWNSQKLNGNAIDYLVNKDLEFRYDFNTAIEELSKFYGTSFLDHDYRVKIDFDIKNIELDKKISRSVAYLNKTRKIDDSIIQFCINEKLIRQTIEYTKDKRKIANLAFLIKDENNKIVGIEKNTLLSNSKFKGFEENSKYGYGFTVSKTQKPKFIFYFESAIDLLSFIQVKGKEKILKNLDKSMFVSLGGVKEHIIKHTQERYNNPEVYICTDNPIIDKASYNFIKNLEKKYKFKKILPTGLYKDWNDMVKNEI